jgi:hypothetical protein
MYVWILWRSEYEKWRKKKAWWERKGGGVDVDGKLCALFLLSFFHSFSWKTTAVGGRPSVSLIHDHKIPEQKIMN